MRKTCLVLIAGLLSLAAPVHTVAADASARSAASAVNVSGVWDAVVETPQGTGSPVFTFKQDGAKLTGKYNGQLGEAPLTGAVKGNEITFTFTVNAGEKVTVEYRGTVEGAAMKGTTKFGEDGEGTFTARKRT